HKTSPNPTTIEDIVQFAVADPLPIVGSHTGFATCSSLSPIELRCSQWNNGNFRYKPPLPLRTRFKHSPFLQQFVGHPDHYSWNAEFVGIAKILKSVELLWLRPKPYLRLFMARYRGQEMHGYSHV